MRASLARPIRSTGFRGVLSLAAVAVIAGLCVSCSATAGAPARASDMTVSGSTADSAVATAETTTSTGIPLAPITVLPPPSTAPPTLSGADRTASTPPAPSAPSTTGASTTAPSGTTNPGRPAPSVPDTAPAPPAPSQGTPPTGTVVVIDPGHNGGNAAHPEIIHRQVPAGFGKTKACNTTGTATSAGYPEHAFNWGVATALRDLLQAKGITIVMTRDSDDGVGPCVNKRAEIGNDAHAAAVVSIHGDGESPGVHGFFVMTASRPPAGPQVAAETGRLARDIRSGMVTGGFEVSNAIGTDGLWRRSDLAGLNLSLRPTVMIECGNMRNAAEAKAMSSAAGQRRYAQGIANGVLKFLGR